MLSFAFVFLQFPRVERKSGANDKFHKSLREREFKASVHIGTCCIEHLNQ